MKFKLIAASLVVLTAFVQPSFAENGDQGKAMQAPKQTPDLQAALKKVQRFLAAGQNLNSLSGEELRLRQATARELASTPELPTNLKRELQRAAVAAREELASRQAADSKTTELAGRQQKNQQVTKEQVGSGEIESTESGDAEPPLRRRPRPVVVEDQQPAKEQVGEIESADGGDSDSRLIRKPRPAVAEDQQPQQEQVEVSENSKTQPTRTADSEEERAARRLLSNARPSDQVQDERLRERLAEARQLLKSKRLTDKTSRQLTQMIRADREVVRKRQAELQATEDRNRQVQEAARNPSANKPKVSVDINIDLRPNTIVLRDRRRAEELSMPELRQRIQVYRDIENADDYRAYGESDRAYWREQLRYDRDFLRRQLLEERTRRETALDTRNEREIVINVRPQRVEVDEDVFAAEADDEDIQDILVSAPRQQPTRRYNVEEVASRPELRKAIPRIEVDTIRFGFNESIVREEEIDKLDRIGSVIEKIIHKYPNEIFIVEGHTDAVGSDLYNLGLSRARAEAVKAALTTYYSIPARSLKTVGLGERYLKVPTPEPEGENRRVSIGRITAYVGSAE